MSCEPMHAASALCSGGSSFERIFLAEHALAESKHDRASIHAAEPPSAA
jgi:hypothetical protein